MRETSLLRRVLLHGSAIGMRIFRNNTGKLQNSDGVWVAYGLCVGSSDVIGWTPVTITPEMVGRELAVFTALECKAGRNTTTEEQGRFLAVVKAAGGIAGVVRSVDDVDAARRAL